MTPDQGAGLCYLIAALCGWAWWRLKLEDDWHQANDFDDDED